MLRKLFQNWTTPAKLHEAGVLGMNRRNYDVIAKCNKRRLYPLVDNKVLTKTLANKIGINTPGLIGTIEAQHEVKNLTAIVGDYREFVIKPAQGSGGKGVLVIVDYNDNLFTTAAGRKLTYDDVYRHVSNILSGLYSLGGKNDTAVIEELVHFSDIFKDYSYQGVPDVRVIVYKGFPAMAMTRLPTKASEGRANLHQGAVGVGLDICCGKALNAVQYNRPIRYQPDTGGDLLKIEVPYWREHLIIGSKAYEMTNLGYLGADIVLDAYRGPMMLELNARPGLAIQIANCRGLAARLEEIDRSFPQGLNAEERVDYVLNEKH